MELVRRLVMVALAAVALYVLLFGGHAETGPAKGRVVVEYWEKWTGKEAEQMQVIVNDFNDTVGKDKGIYVRYLSMSNITQKTLVSTAGGSPPDVAGLWDNQVPQFAALGAVEPLDDLAAQYGITEDYYKTAYWRACHYDGHLWALISTPAAVALHYNKRLFAKAGLDPNRPPRTLDELDRDAAAIDTFATEPNGKRRIVTAGYLPMDPGWYLVYTGWWFGANIYDEKSGKFTLTSPAMIRTFEWVRSYSERLGKDAMVDFNSGLGQFNSAQNPFISGSVAMEQQGPWMANYIENLKPSMNHVRFSREQEKALPFAKRRDNYEWGVAAFPSAVPGLEDVTYTGFDALMIPRGAKHKKEAFEFIAYVNRQDVMEKLTALHCKNTPLRHVSQAYLENHPNPYIDVFERLANSKNAQGVPPVPIWPEVADEMNVAIQKVYLLQATPKDALTEAQTRLQEKLDTFRARQAARQGGKP